MDVPPTAVDTVPTGQSAHVVDPADEYVLTGQSSHPVVLAVMNVPAGHVIEAVAPAAQ